ncbi:MAG: hypothetical protein JW727_02105 [Candidatus Aenigmarchaeota archaeon]|nr:hypothetical protein [Candidatus Aenigmarchaeota archaeon]
MAKKRSGKAAKRSKKQAKRETSASKKQFKEMFPAEAKQKKAPAKQKEEKAAEEPVKDEEEQKPEEKPCTSCNYGLYLALGAVAVVVILAIYSTINGGIGGKGYVFPQLSENVRVCEDNYLCFMDNGTWYRPQYNAGTNLSYAVNFPTSNGTEIARFFENDRINLVFGASEETGPENSELILSVTPFSYYLSHYYAAYEGKNKGFDPYFLKDYTLDEPAIIILGPGMGANETSLSYDGKNVVVQGETFEDLRLVLGKLLIIAIRGE